MAKSSTDAPAAPAAPATATETPTTTKAADPAPAAPAAKRFKVTLGDKSGEYEAANEKEAWALFCDAHKHWPSPKTAGREIVELK